MAHSGEIQILNLCAKGDRAAFEEVVRRYQNLICSMAYSALGNHARSEDLAQETFVTAWVQLKSLQDLNKFKAWLCGIARNLINQSIRKEGRNPVASAASLEMVAETAGGELSPAEEAIRAEEEALVWQSLEKIPEAYREPLVLYYREDHSIHRVAEALDLTPDTVKQRLSRGREMLRQEVTRLVESALTKSKPAGTFTAGVIMALPLAVPQSAAAAGAAGTVAKTSGAISSGMSAVALLKLMVIGWCVKVGLDSTRSPREKRLYIGVLLGELGALTLFCIALFAPEWIGLNFMTGNPSRPAALMAIMIFPFIAVLFFLGRRLEKIRVEEETWVEDQPVISDGADCLSRQGVVARFAAGTFGSGAPLAALAIFMHDWTDLTLIALTASLACGLGAAACFRQPRRYFVLMVNSAGVTGAIALVITFLGLASPTDSAVTTAADSDGFIAALSCTILSIVIVSVLAWKRSDLMKKQIVDTRSARQD